MSAPSVSSTRELAPVCEDLHQRFEIKAQDLAETEAFGETWY